jgi:hypothetical protein
MRRAFTRSAARACAATAVCLIGWVSDALALDLPPWIEPGDIPLPAGVVSVMAMQDDLPVEAGPAASGQRRGALAQGIALPLFALRRGPGCAGRWVNIGPLAWVCQDRTRLAAVQPIGAREASWRPASDGLPYRYFFVGRGGSSGYYQLGAADQTAPDQDLEPGFAVTVVEQRRHQGELYGRSHHGLWMPMRDLGPVRAPVFHGEPVTDGKLDFAWVLADDATVLTKPAAGARGARRLARHQLVRVLEERTDGREGFYRIDDGTWVRDKDVRRPSVAPPPAEVQPGERWIDVDLARQVLVAYEGTRPVYATLVSTGKGGPGGGFATPRGVHRIWVKLVASTMDNLEDEEAAHYYSIEDVPFVQFFSHGVGLHGAFWHNGFGRVRSHGCVNLPPLDAQWLFGWTSPHLPAGWTAVLPTDLERGTVVRVR